MNIRVGPTLHIALNATWYTKRRLVVSLTWYEIHATRSRCMHIDIVKCMVHRHVNCETAYEIAWLADLHFMSCLYNSSSSREFHIPSTIQQVDARHITRSYLVSCLQDSSRNSRERLSIGKWHVHWAFQIFRFILT